MKKSFLPLLLAVLCLSCENPKPKITTGDDPHIDSLLTRARANAKIQFEEIDRKMEAHQDSIDPLRSKQTTTSASIATQYIFVRLEIEEDKGMKIQQGNFVSGIQEIKSLTEDEKARLEDQVLAEYLKSSGAQLFNGRVKKKETFVFSSYKEASAKRNSFLISE
ncbi:hypothetical protein SAMN05421786_106159 [Chryseobacterium ureilyticum]|uniref:Uncharacterized protein n=1 Tax=Chryseobacterium ureilyticum TaxID=373668 RepID=A0A1N7PT00_9FLAO|nr:hypothetical protein [Chryseobacterium ureilyticum]SIT13680.1 hypothetical protein SAMN05421786_106159 [Chryseobacterium ureilyticum]